MYQKDKYVKNDPDYIFKFIQNHPFATFVVQGETLLGTHIPILAEGEANDFRLYGHISDEYNKQIDILQEGLEALIIFHGPQAYVSSSWYQKKNISTWDYQAVHVNARIKIQSRNELEESLKNLVHHFEKEQDAPLYYHDIPDKMIQSQLPLITGFWAEPFRIEAVAKLHQGFGKDDITSVVTHLKKKGDNTSNELGNEILKEHNAND